MNNAQALRKLKKLLGKTATYEIHKGAPNAEARAEIQKHMPALVAAKIAAEDAAKQRMEKILADDAEYQRLKVAREAARTAYQNASGLRHHFPISVGTVSKVGGIGFLHVSAQGDTWADVFAKLEKRS